MAEAADHPYSHVMALWAVAVAVCFGTGPGGCIAALVAAGIITGFTLPSFKRAYDACRARR
jgi:hypothetical protein